MKYNIPEVRVHIQENWHMNQIAIWFTRRDHTGQLFTMKMVEEPIQDGAYTEPSLIFSAEDGVPLKLKNELQKLGILHNADQATNEALKYHLEDMRKLVFTPPEPINITILNKKDEA